MINKAILLGNLCADPEMRSTQSGMSIANMRIATNSRRKVGDSWEDVAEFHTVVAFGKTAENIEKFCAKGKQLFIEGRIQELEFVLSHCQLIDVSSLNAGTRVVFGATVELADCDSGDEVTYQIVGDLEADIKQGLISISSPLARALIGKHEGDTVTIQAPAGARDFDIVAVRYEG